MSVSERVLTYWRVKCHSCGEMVTPFERICTLCHNSSMSEPDEEIFQEKILPILEHRPEKEWPTALLPYNSILNIDETFLNVNAPGHLPANVKIAGYAIGTLLFAFAIFPILAGWDLTVVFPLLLPLIFWLYLMIRITRKATRAEN